MEINKNMLIGDLIEMDGEMVEILMKYGMNCSGCPGSNTESLEEAVIGHSANLEEIMEEIKKHFREKA